MPNHVTSRCTITGPSDEVARFREMMIVTKMEEREDHWPDTRETKAYTTLDFNAIIPMPAALVGSTSGGNCDFGSQLFLIANANPFSPLGTGAALYNHEVARLNQAATEGDLPHRARAFLNANADVREAGLAALRAIVETGYADWYEWSIDHWGTKWGAYDFEEVSAEPLTIKFETAWSFPTPVFEKLAETFPTLTFDCICFDEGWNFAGVGGFGVTGKTFETVEATDELYEAVYGCKPERDEEDAA